MESSTYVPGKVWQRGVDVLVAVLSFQESERVEREEMPNCVRLTLEVSRFELKKKEHKRGKGSTSRETV